MSQLNIFHDFKSKNFDSRRKKIDFIILHYTETINFSEALKLLTSSSRKVSSHYLIDTDGSIYNLVKDSKRAWHAGVSSWNELEDMNSRSIGIEIVYIGEKKSNFYPDIQIVSLIGLIKNLIKKYNISYQNVLGHSDIAPLRKIDPGKYFPWKKLSENMIGLWAESKKKNDLLSNEELKLFLRNLKEIGYPNIKLDSWDKKNLKVIDAFHRHFSPDQIGKKPTKSSLSISNSLLKLKIT